MTIKTSIDRNEQEITRLRAIIRQAIWDFGMGRPDMALVCLRYAGVDEAPLPDSVPVIENNHKEAK